MKQGAPILFLTAPNARRRFHAVSSTQHAARKRFHVRTDGKKENRPREMESRTIREKKADHAWNFSTTSLLFLFIFGKTSAGQYVWGPNNIDLIYVTCIIVFFYF